MFIVLRGKGLANIDTLTWKESDEWVLGFRDGTQAETHLLPSSYASTWLVVLNFNKAENRRAQSVVLFRDAFDEESFRRLRVRLGMDGKNTDN